MSDQTVIRRNFEQWFSAGNPQCKSIERYADGRYKFIGAYNAWVAWQAATEIATIANLVRYTKVRRFNDAEWTRFCNACIRLDQPLDSAIDELSMRE